MNCIYTFQNLGIVLTNYNNSMVTQNAAASIFASPRHKDIKLVVVDNNSSKREKEILKNGLSIYKNVVIIFSDKNLGYFNGLNQGITLLKNNHPEIKIIMIGNNDIEIPEKFFSKLINKCDIINKYPVISPDIITPKGVHQNPHSINGSSVFREIMYDIYHMSYFASVLINWISIKTSRLTDRKDEQYYDNAQEIHQGYGAFYILSPLFFKYYDSLWAPTLIMGEEYFLSLQLKKIGYKTFYEPTLQIIHHDHTTVRKIPPRDFWVISKKAHIVYRKHKDLLSMIRQFRTS